MSLANWPSGLPAPLASGSLQPGAVADTLAMDAQNERLYRRAASPSRLFAATWALTAAEFDRFRQFALFDTGFGCQWFSAPWLDWLAGSGHVGRFTAPPEASRQALLFEARATVEIQLAGLALLPVGGDWALNVVADTSSLPSDGMVFHWSAASEPTADGGTVPYLSSLHDAGASRLSAQASSHTMQTVGGRRLAAGVSASQFAATAGPVTASNRNWTLALCCAPTATPGQAAVGPLRLEVTAGLASLYGADNSANLSGQAAHVLRPSGRAVFLLTAQRRGRAKVYGNGFNLIDAASDWQASTGLLLWYGRWHEVAAWDRVLSANELARATACLSAGWAV